MSAAVTSGALTAERLQQLADDDDMTRRFLARRLARTYDEFLSVLTEDLLQVVGQLEQNPQAHEHESEDQTTQAIVDMLSVMGFKASHDMTAGGNVDLTVEIVARGFRWIAEAKKFDSVADLSEGYRQLATRYRSGGAHNGVLHGGMLAYLRRPAAVKCMGDWKERLQELAEAPNVQISACNLRGDLGFNSEHKHQDYGLPLRVWHVCVVLHFLPLDASGRRSEAGRRRIQQSQTKAGASASSGGA